ncbi:MAG: KxYKxGKxW signal peptide domain-containing protein [Lactobacillus sp.]|nr:KxYKxGKxW signal peptide domain-containing protein [Lactobacillus sp.]
MFQRNNQDPKLHYKMYKAGKHWLFAGLAAVSFGLTLADKPQVSQGATAPTQTTNQVSTKPAATAPASAGQNTATTAPKPVTAPVAQAAGPTGPTATPAANATAAPKVQNTPEPSAAKTAPVTAGTPTTSNQADTAAKPNTGQNDAATATKTAPATAEQQPTAVVKDAGMQPAADSTAKNEPTKPVTDAKTPAATDANESAVKTDPTTTAKTAEPQVDANAAGKTAAKVSDPATNAATKATADAKTTTKATDPKTAVTAPAKTAPEQPTVTDYPSAKAKTDQANDLAAKANQSAAALQALLKDPKPGDTAWQTQVNAALKDLSQTSDAFTGTKVTTDDVVKAYQDILKNMPNQPQPSAIQSVKVGDKDEAATLDNYNKLVDSYTAQVQTLLDQVKAGQANYATATALNAAQQQLKTAADQLNAAIQQAVTSANAGDTNAAKQAITGADTKGQTLDDYKKAYDDALTAYNSNVDVYNSTTTAAQQQVTPLGTNADTATTPDPTKNPADKTFTDFKDEITKTAAQNNAYNHYETANDAYHQAQTGFTNLAGAVSDWQTAANNYNQLVSGVNAGTTAKLTEADLQAQQTAVTNAQTNLTKVVNQFATDNTTYQKALGDYQSALDTYTTATGQANLQAAPGYEPSNPASPWNQFQNHITKLQNDFTPTGTATDTVPGQNDAVMQRNMTQFQAMVKVDAAAQDLQAKITQINAAASAQQAAATAWNDLTAKAKDDGRWAFFYPQIHSAGDDLTQKDYQYIDAVNGTTTPMTTTTKKADFDKTYSDSQVGDPTANYSAKDYTDPTVTKTATNASYTYLVNTYLDAVAAYNAGASTANKISSGDPTAAAAMTTAVTDFQNKLEGANGFTAQYQQLLQKLAGVAADPAQNAQALATLSNPTYFSTDGSQTAQRHNNTKIQTLTEAVIFGTGGWQDILKLNFNNAAYLKVQSFNPLQYTVTDNGAGHQLSETALQQIFQGQWDDPGYDPTDFTLQPTYKADGKTYYLAGYGVFQANNTDGNIKGTNQFFTFTSGQAEQEFVQNGLKLIGDTSQNSYINIYYVAQTDYDAIATPTATGINALAAPSLKLDAVSAYGTDTAVPAPTPATTAQATGPTYLTGTTVKPDFQKPDVTVQAPTITLNQPVTPTPSTPSIPGGSGTPDEPENPGTPSEPGTPGEPGNPDNPGTPGEPGTPGNPDNPDNPGTPTNPGTPDNPDEPNNPGEPVNPDTPIQPGNPNNPSNPGNPSTPNNPGNPSNPGTPNMPSNPDTPGKPGTPSNPETPSYSEAPSNSGTSGAENIPNVGTPTTQAPVNGGADQGWATNTNQNGQLTNLANHSQSANQPAGNQRTSNQQAGQQSAQHQANRTSKAATLPQTGEKSDTNLTVLGTILTALAAFFGWFATAHKREH